MDCSRFGGEGGFFRKQVAVPACGEWRDRILDRFFDICPLTDDLFLTGIASRKYAVDTFNLVWDGVLERSNFHAPLISNVERELVQAFLRMLVQRGILESAPIPGSCVFHPVIVIPKAAKGKLRLVIDFRGLNLLFKDVAFDLKDRTKVIRSIPSKSRYFSSIDIKDAFFQIKIESEKLRDLFSIHVLNESYRFCRLPQGFKLSPYICQLVYESILFPECEGFVAIYMDDLLIFSETLEDHWKHVNRVMEILQSENIQIGWNKAVFCKEEVEYLGVVFSSKGIRPADDIRIKLEKLIDLDCSQRSNWQLVQGLLMQYVRFGPRLVGIADEFKNGTIAVRKNIIEQISNWVIFNVVGDKWVLFTDWSSLGRGMSCAQGAH